MHQFFPRQTGKAGLPPGKTVYVGPSRDAIPRVRLVDYSPSGVDEREVPRDEIAGLRQVLDSDSITWIDVDGVHDVALLEEIGKVSGLHALNLEDIANTGQRPKIEDHGEHLFVAFKMLTVHYKGLRFVTEHVTLIIGPRHVLSFQEQPGDGFDPVRDRIREGRGRIRRMGADYLAYCLVDAVVDGYFHVVTSVGDQIEDLEDEVEEGPASHLMEELHRVRRDLIYLRKITLPLREAVGTWRRADTDLLRKDTLPFLADLHDHTTHVMESVDALRDLASGVIELHRSNMDARMNEVMKVLTMIATVFIPMSFVAGLYGMNFDVMPELHQPWGYPAAVGVMVAVALGMMVFFRRKGWL